VVRHSFIIELLIMLFTHIYTIFRAAWIFFFYLHLTGSSVFMHAIILLSVNFVLFTKTNHLWFFEHKKYFPDFFLIVVIQIIYCIVFFTFVSRYFSSSQSSFE
jgi:hypothetical protein